MLPLDANEIVVELVYLLQLVSALDIVLVRVLKVDVPDEPAVIELWLLVFFQRVAGEHIEAVDLSHLALSFVHAHLVDLAAETLAAAGEHLEELSGHQYLGVIGIAQGVDALGNLSILRQIQGIYLEFGADGSLDGSADMQCDGDVDIIPFVEVFLDIWVSRVRDQLILSAQHC